VAKEWIMKKRSLFQKKEFIQKTVSSVPAGSLKIADSNNHTTDSKQEVEQVFFPIGITVSFHYDLINSKFKMVGSDIEKLVGIGAKEILNNNGIDFLAEVMVDEQVEALGILIQHSYQLCAKYSNPLEVVFNIDYNIVTRQKEHKRILCQYRAAQVNDLGYPTETIGYWTDITHFRKEGLPTLFVMTNNKLDYVEFANPEMVIKSHSIIYTNKEITLIKLTSDGYRIKEIANKMNISVSTVYTHRKNIRLKSEKEMNQVINDMKAKGII
jgi:hypothetical protein